MMDWVLLAVREKWSLFLYKLDFINDKQCMTPPLERKVENNCEKWRKVRKSIVGNQRKVKAVSNDE